ncbi:MAG: DUF2452 domain-containing protein [Cyclobacteriaceae bacterium]|nr:DUF2452 domain-containing protein [Cyclobacteriaceae bacterium]MCH8516052.1 DUF2452 domain-containing protein [Cyclobacteriaceae bacterium]
MTKKGFDISQYDFEKEAEKIAEKPGLLPYAHTAGGVPIKPEDKGKLKTRAVQAMYEQSDMQLSQIKEQIDLLAKQAKAIQERTQLSERIYLADMGFEPLIGKSYFLYNRNEGMDTLSMVAPEEWGKKLPFKKFLGEVKLLADHTWEVTRTEIKA